MDEIIYKKAKKKRKNEEEMLWTNTVQSVSQSGAGGPQNTLNLAQGSYIEAVDIHILLDDDPMEEEGGLVPHKQNPYSPKVINPFFNSGKDMP